MLELWFSQKICSFTKISVMCEGTLLVYDLLLNFLEISIYLKKKGGQKYLEGQKKLFNSKS